MFTCHVVGDSNTPVSVGIYYPSEWILLVAKLHLSVPCMCLCLSFLLHGTVSVAISLDVGEDTFSVTCAATGGTVIASSFTGPGVTSDLQPVGTVGRTSQNTYSAEILALLVMVMSITAL